MFRVYRCMHTTAERRSVAAILADNRSNRAFSDDDMVFDVRGKRRKLPHERDDIPRSRCDKSTPAKIARLTRRRQARKFKMTLLAAA